MNMPFLLDSVEENAPRYNGTVAIWFTTHFQVSDRDWNSIRTFGGNYHPLGYYKSDDPEVLALQLDGMRRAGVDTIVYDVSAIPEWGPTDFERDRALPILIDFLSHQENEPRPLQLMFYLEHGGSDPTLEELEIALSYIRDHFSEAPYYYRYNGKPLVVCYLNGEAPGMAEIEKRAEYMDYFELRRIRPFSSDDWSYIERYPQAIHKDWMSACPGFDSYLEDALYRRTEGTTLDILRERSAKAERDDGQYYLKQLGLAKQTNPDIIMVSTWNDWQYANQIEPAEEYGYFYVDLTAKFLGRWQETEPYRR